MDKIKNNIIAGLMIVIAVLIMFRGCGKSEPCPAVGVIVERDTILMPVEVEVPVPVNVYKTNWRDVNIYRDILKDVDTSNIINGFLNGITLDTLIERLGETNVLAMVDDYNTKKFYSDTILKEGDFKAVINDSIYQNKIVYREFLMQNLREDRIITIDNSRRRLLLGGGMQFSEQGYFDVKPSVAFMNKRGSLLNYSYGVLNKTHEAGVMFTIKIK